MLIPATSFIMLLLSNFKIGYIFDYDYNILLEILYFK